MALAALVVKIGGDLTGLNRALSQADKDVQKVGKKLAALGKDFSTYLTLPIVALGAAAVHSATQLDSLTRGLTAITGDAGETQRQLVRLKEVAKLPGLGFKEAIQGSISLQAVGFSAAKAERSLMAFGNAIATTGGGKAELDRVFTQLTQMASAGKILTADLRPIIQVSPLVGRALKEAFVTISAEQIGKMGLSFEEFYERLVSQLEKLPKVTGGARNSFENLQDVMFRLSAAFGKGILPVILPLIDNAATLAERFSEMSNATRNTMLVVAALVAGVGPLLLVLGKVMTLLPLIRVGFIALMGPVGIAITVIAALTAAWIKWADESGRASREAAAALDKYAKSLDGLSRAQLVILSADILKKQAGWEKFAPTAFVKEQIAGLEAQLIAVATAFKALPSDVKIPKVIIDKDYVKNLIEAVDLNIASVKEMEALKVTYDETNDKLRAGNLALEDRIKLQKQLNDIAEAMPSAAMRALPALADISKLMLAVQRTPSRFTVPDITARAGAAPLPPSVAKAPGLGRGDMLAQQASFGVGREASQVIRGIEMGLGPMALLLPVINGAMEKLAPVLEMLLEPLVEIGGVIGNALAPILKMLVPVIQLVADMFLRQLAPVLKVMTFAFSFLMEGLGFLVKGIGMLIDALPFVSAKGVIETGQAMIDAARAARKNADATDDATDAVQTFAGALSNIPRVLNINLLRHLLGGTSGTAGGSAGSAGASGGTGTGGTDGTVYNYINITVPGAGDPDRVAEKVAQSIMRTRARGGMSRLAVAVAIP